MRQRQSPLAGLMLLVTAGPVAALQQSPATPATPLAIGDHAPGVQHIESAHPVLAVAESDGYLLLGLGRHGFGWSRLEEDGSLGTPQYREEWPTLSLLDLPGDDCRVLLGGRDGVLRLVDLAAPNPSLIYEWEGEGLACGLAIQGDLLAVGGAAGGVTLWEWADPLRPPYLVGRYPFLGYAKKVAFRTESQLVVADVYEPGILLLDVVDPLRPRHLETVSVHTFCDSFALYPGGVVVTDRNLGTADVPETPGAAPTTYSPAQATSKPLHYDAPNAASQAVSCLGGRLAIAEGADGVRLLHWDEGTLHWIDHARLDTPGLAVDVSVLSDGRIAAAAHHGGAVVFDWPAPESNEPLGLDP